MRNHVQIGRFVVGPLEENEISDFLIAHGGRLVDTPPPAEIDWLRTQIAALRKLVDRILDEMGTDYSGTVRSWRNEYLEAISKARPPGDQP